MYWTSVEPLVSTFKSGCEVRSWYFPAPKEKNKKSNLEMVSTECKKKFRLKRPNGAQTI